MSELQDRMDVVDQYDYNYAVFRWMDEATREIKRLQSEIDALNRTLQSRTEHLV